MEEKTVQNMKEWTKRVTASPEAATRTLITLGVLDKNGKPSKHYYPQLATSK